METKKVINLIILDASGSMSTIYNQALGGVNETLGAIRVAQNEHPELKTCYRMIQQTTATP